MYAKNLMPEKWEITERWKKKIFANSSLKNFVFETISNPVAYFGGSKLKS